MAEVLEPTREGILKAVEILRRGGIVAFPTETVYGMGCDATNEEALKRLYEVKGRSLDKPFIVGVWSKEIVSKIAEVDDRAKKLMDAYFPGPLTLVLKSKGSLPQILSPAGKIAVRMPAHHVPLKLMEELERPIVVPSANISGRPSLTRWEHVVEELGERIDAVIKGECKVGIESTIVDLTVNPAKVLRVGAIDVKSIKRHVEVVVEPIKGTYTLSCSVYVFAGEKAREKIEEFVEEMSKQGKKVVVIAREKITDKCISIGKTREEYSAKLFDAVREAEFKRPDLIVIEGIMENEGIMDRLRRLAGERIFRV
ncbi:L-threonylcarbamoyladenylate synthase [Archaeoglobus sp.]